MVATLFIEIRIETDTRGMQYPMCFPEGFFFCEFRMMGKGGGGGGTLLIFFSSIAFVSLLFLPRERLTHKQHRMSELHISSPVILLGVCKALARRASFGLAWPHTAGICSSHLFICHFLRISSRILRPDTVIRF